MEAITWAQFAFISINIILVLVMVSFLFMSMKVCTKKNGLKGFVGFLFLVSCAFGTLYTILELNIKLGGL